jgi:hypothetical protein
LSDQYVINVDRREIASEENLSMLREAAEELFSATEADFEQIKSRKWYKRLWQMITFSRENEILLAKNMIQTQKGSTTAFQ